MAFQGSSIVLSSILVLVSASSVTQLPVPPGIPLPAPVSPGLVNGLPATSASSPGLVQPERSVGDAQKNSSNGATVAAEAAIAANAAAANAAAAAQRANQAALAARQAEMNSSTQSQKGPVPQMPQGEEPGAIQAKQAAVPQPAQAPQTRDLSAAPASPSAASASSSSSSSSAFASAPAAAPTIPIVPVPAGAPAGATGPGPGNENSSNGNGAEATAAAAAAAAPAAAAPSSSSSSSSAEEVGSSTSSSHGFTRLSALLAGLTFAAVVKTLCMASNVLVQLSPFPQVKRWEFRGCTGEADAAPYVSIAFGGWQWCYYGLFAYIWTERSGFLILVHSNFLGAALGTYYTWTFYKNCRDPEMGGKLRNYLHGVAGVVIFQACALATLPPQRALFLTGLVSSFCSFLGALSMLVTVPSVIDTKNSRAIPGPIVVANFFSGFVWCLCGWILADPLVMGPNVVSVMASSVCIYLKLAFPDLEEGDFLGTELGEADEAGLRKAHELSPLLATPRGCAHRTPSLDFSKEPGFPRSKLMSTIGPPKHEETPTSGFYASTATASSCSSLLCAGAQQTPQEEERQQQLQQEEQTTSKGKDKTKEAEFEDEHSPASDRSSGFSASPPNAAAVCYGGTGGTW